MNILYISKLWGHKWTGPNQSVPRQIKAQSNHDNVFWYNINKTINHDWDELIKYHNTIEYPKISMDSLPVPFNSPDLIVFQGVYSFPFNKIIFEAWKRKIPYVIVTRGALPKSAQKNKLIKKKIGNFLFFNKFIKKAAGIHYLTEREYIDSGNKWNENHFVIPNGINVPNNIKKNHQNDFLKGVYIGRMDMYQKGLDMLMKVCIDLKSDFLKNNIKIELYGPDMNGAKKKISKIIEDNDLHNILSLHEGVFDREKEKILCESDFFIMTSRFEGHPMGLIEALSYGVPSLVTEGSNMAKEIENNLAGWTSESEVESIKKSFKNLLSDKNNLKKFSENAYNLSKDYKWEKIAEVTSINYKKLLH